MKNAKTQLLELSKESLEYISIVVPAAVSLIYPGAPPEVLITFATAIKSTCGKIIDKALDCLDEGADIREIDVDWRAHFFDKCRIVHDEDMQNLWAKILAGEANKPGTYSKRTVNFVAELDKREAELFTNLCRYVCKMKIRDNINLMPLLFSFDDSQYQIPNGDLNHLDSIGLIRLNDPPDSIRLNESIEVNYYGEDIRLSLPDNESSKSLSEWLHASHIELTQIGKELYPISGSAKVDGLLNYVCNEIWDGYVRD